MSGGRGDKGLGLLRCREGRAAREFIFAGAGIGLIKDRSEHILTSELLPVRLRAPESIAGRDFDNRLSVGRGHGSDKAIGLELPRDDIGHCLDVHVLPVGTRLVEMLIGRSEEHTSELQSLMRISYAVFCLKNKKKQL